jgi:hypothetical protein
MKERPILFSGPMVRAILEGRKTQTRRIMNPPPSECFMPEVGRYHPTVISRDGEAFPGPETFGASDESEGYPCRHGQPGDRLWVKETFYPQGPNSFFYRADWNDEDGEPDWNWKPSIFCTRKASRITLEITAVRVERLQDITIEDAIAEGCSNYAPDYPNSTKPAVTAYHTLWESINGPGSWAKNPWVWVIEFRRVEP